MFDLRVTATVLALSVGSMASATTFSATTVVGGNVPFSTVQPSLAMNAYVNNITGEIRWHAAARTGDFRDARLANGIGTIDLRGRALVGSSASNPVGTLSGAPTAQLGIENLPSHTHGFDDGRTSTATGGGQAFSIAQPTYAANHEIAVQGIYPSRDGINGASQNEVMAFVHHSVGPTPTNPYRMETDGRKVPVNQNPALFSLLGNNFGGDARNDFGLPDLSDRVAVGTGRGPGLTPRILGSQFGSQTESLSLAQMPRHTHDDKNGMESQPTGGTAPVNNMLPSLALNYVIAVGGVYPALDGGNLFGQSESLMGEIALFAGNFAPRGYMFAEGQLLAISQFQALFSLLGTTYGGDGRTSFALPDLRGRTLVGAGAGGILGDLQVGQKLGSETTVLGVGNLPAHSHLVEDPVAPVPLPGGLVLLVGALGVLGGLRRRA